MARVKAKLSPEELDLARARIRGLPTEAVVSYALKEYPLD
jgi:hypothetical protein